MCAQSHSNVPSVIGPYRIEKQIGKGGMGSVYRAYDSRLERVVALKRIHKENLARHYREWLRREAKATAQISHPNIVQVFDILDHAGADWIVMEFVAGLTLRQAIDSRTLTIKKVVELCLEICQGLAAAHAQGIVHRDLKAENIILTPEGQAKILDFGLAKWNSASEDLFQAQEGRVQGTPRSMSPEQALGMPLDHRSDLFSLGVLMYEALSDQSPFQGQLRNVYKILSRICTHQQQPLREVSPKISKPLSDLVDQLLEKEPERRPQSAEEVLVALQRVRDAPESSMRVLFVDDEPDFEHLIRQRYRRQIRSRKMSVSFARNGNEALRKLAEEDDIDLVFTDLNMPEMDGLTLIQELREREVGSTTVIISAYGDLPNIRSAMNLGAFDFLTKPLDFRDLDATLKKASEAAAQSRESLRLREENQLLDKRNRFIRDAFGRFLRGDPRARELFEPLLEQQTEGLARHVTLLIARFENLEAMTEKLAPAVLFEALDQFFGSLVEIAQQHRGSILGFGRSKLSIGFGMAIPRKEDAENAVNCAVELRSTVETLSRTSEQQGGPRIVLRVAIDSGQMAASGSMSTAAVGQRASEVLGKCAAQQILVTEATLVEADGLGVDPSKTLHDSIYEIPVPGTLDEATAETEIIDDL